jgi:predicted nucleotidyltransferase
MMNTYIDISDKFATQILIEILREVDKATQKLDIPFFIVGATARDLILEFGFGLKPGRATADVDIGVRVSSWENFNRLKKELGAGDKFRAHGEKCRMVHESGTPIDLLPFGLNSSGTGIVEWPPEDGEELNMNGFAEAFEYSIEVCISSKPELVVKVASPAGLVLLKLLAWNDRKPETKDAIDLGYLVRDYLDFGNMERLINEHEDLVQVDEFDYQVAGARLLGRDLAQTCDRETRELLVQILVPELDRSGDLPLIVQSAGSSPEINRTYEFWSAIYDELTKLEPNQ